MHSFLRKRNLLFTGLFALAVAAAIPSTATAAAVKPKPGVGKPGGFRLFARSLGALTINRVLCGLATTGEVCVDSTNSSTIGGGFWPKGTADQNVFNSGLQIAGIIGPEVTAWAGDTTGAFFFDPKGTTQHGEQVEPIFNSTNPDDNAFVSDTTATCNEVCRAAKVPSGDSNQDLFFPLLRGRTAASQGDVWWLSWDGNPTQSAGRPHPLGVLVEQRGMGWNYPSGNEDIIYFIYTFYNVTARDAGVYSAAGVRPGMADILARQGAEFQDKNEAAFGIQIPDAGYTINNMFAAFSADMDVAEATVNFSSVNVPFALGYVYAHDFAPADGWTFDPGIFAPPFFPGSGFVGVKYLKSPIGPSGTEVGLTLFSNTINQGAFDDAQNTTQLFRYLSNNINPAAGDAPCNTGNPQLTKICFVNNTAPDDMRFFQSSGPLNLAPGQFGTIAVAYIFAAPVSVGACTGPGTCDLTPGDPRRLSAVATADNANSVDSVAGFRGYTTDLDGNNVADQGEFAPPVPGSLLGKALVAQQVFNFGFLLPFAPEAPDFFLVPGDNQVTVLWRPSATETTGDPFFVVASALTVTDPESGLLVPNTLYDPNYRQFDVEGYRVYRGRVDSPNELSLIAQFDYSGTSMLDFQGQVNPVAGCAPELGINTQTIVPAPPPVGALDTIPGCVVPFDSLVPGVAPTVSNEVPLVGPILQVRRGDRTKLATGEAIMLKVDTALTGSASGHAPELSDNGVPFTFRDDGVRSNLRYFYSVTAFDVNSIQSGPSAIESPRNTKSVIPQAAAGNFQSAATLSQTLEGRAGALTDTLIPAIDPVTGIFSKRFPPANGAQIGFVGTFAQTVFSGNASFSATLIGLSLGDARNGPGVGYTYQTVSSANVTDTLTVSVQQEAPTSGSGTALATGLSVPFSAATADPDLLARFGVPAGFVQFGQITQQLPAYQRVLAFGRGCHIDLLFDPNCSYNGPRWFQGANETKADPNGGNVAGSEDATNNNNAGELPGILTIQNPQSYTQVSAAWRIVEAELAGAVRAADFNVYWGAAGLIDSVIDLTHDVPVPFMADSLGAGWGILNQSNTSAAPSADASVGVLSLADFGCVLPIKNLAGGAAPPGGALNCPAATTYTLSNTAVPGQIAIAGGSVAAANPTARPNPGFAMYISGIISLFELQPATTVPAAGTVWTLRSYTGVVKGGNGAARAQGPYSFIPTTRPFSALGATLRQSFSATNALAAATTNDLTRVHTVPDPYYVTSQFEQTTDTKIIKFVNLPTDCIIRIYSSSGVLVSLLEHHSTQFGGAEDWNVRNRNNQVVASGVYFFHIESGGARRVGRFTVVNFAQ
jgi:hypothetical protein